MLCQRPERRFKILRAPNVRWNDLHVQGPRRCFDLSEFSLGRREETRIPQDAHTLGLGDGYNQEFQPFGSGIQKLQAQAGEVAARPGETRDETKGNRISDFGKDDWDRLGGRLGRARRQRANGEDDIRLKPNELVREAWKDLDFVLRAPPLEGNVPAFDVAEIA